VSDRPVGANREGERGGIGRVSALFDEGEEFVDFRVGPVAVSDTERGEGEADVDVVFELHGAAEEFVDSGGADDAGDGGLEAEHEVGG